MPCVAATALAVARGFAPRWDVLCYALGASFLIQIGTNLVNDAMDHKKGADTHERIGPQRITQAGIFSFRAVMSIATLCFLLAVLCGVPLVMVGGLPIVVIGLVSVLMGYAYTAGPFPLAYVGMGDLFVILFFGLIAVSGMYFLQTGLWDYGAAWLGLQIGLHATVLIAINNARDLDGDRRVGKMTLAARFGLPFARAEIALLAFLPFVMNVYWFSTGQWKAGVASFFALPIAILVCKRVFRTAPGVIYNKFLAMSAGLHLAFGLLISGGFWFA